MEELAQLPDSMLSNKFIGLLGKLFSYDSSFNGLRQKRLELPSNVNVRDADEQRKSVLQADLTPDH